MVISLLGYVNHRHLKLPDALGVTAVSMLASLALLLAGNTFPTMVDNAEALVGAIDFPALVFNGLLGVLLFAGALHVDISTLKQNRTAVFLLTTVGVLLSTFIIGTGLYLLLSVLGVDLSFLWCLAFGALISPTDPVAVLSVLKTAGVPPTIEGKIAGEALFNDATSVVLFATLSALAAGTQELSFTAVGLSLAREVVGALLCGLSLGFLVTWMLSRVHSYLLEILFTLSLATFGYSLAMALHVSAPLAVVVMGLVVGNRQLTPAWASPSTSEQLFGFWGVLDELLNLILFGLIGLQLLVLPFNGANVLVGVLTVVIALVARFLSVGAPLMLVRPTQGRSPHLVKLLTWGGLRGGVSIALALSLPQFEGRDTLVIATYVVVAFSLLVQGTTLGPLVKRLNAKTPGQETPGLGR